MATDAGGGRMRATLIHTLILAFVVANFWHLHHPFIDSFLLGCVVSVGGNFIASLFYGGRR